MKKLACLMVVAVLLVVSMIPAFAAAGINDYEQKITTYIKTAYVVDGYTITVPGEYFTALENVWNKVDLTEAQYNQIKAILDKALAFCKSKHLVEVEDITKTGSTETLLGYIREALAVLGYTLSTQGSLTDADHGLLIIADPDGNIIARLHPNVVKSKNGAVTKTGADYTAAVVGGASAVAVLAAACVSLKKFRKETDED